MDHQGDETSTVLHSDDISIIGGHVEVVGGGRHAVIGPGERIVIGRMTSCRLCLGERSVSAVHLEIESAEDGLYYRDLATTNGTWIGDASVNEGKIRGPTILRLGTTVTVLVTPTGPAGLAERYPIRFGGLVGESPRMLRVLAQLSKWAPTDESVFIGGESGTGKELAARALHDGSPRKKTGAFVATSCADLPPSLLEAALFGNVKGAFTGADHARKGLFVQADRGTLFLDEIAEAPLDLQAKFLRALQEHQVTPVGSDKPIKVDVRVISASHKDLTRAIEEKKFREDLFFRLGVLKVTMPPLRSRLDDIPLLVLDMLKGLNRPDVRIDRATMLQLQTFRDPEKKRTWPGNVRQLHNLIRAALSVSNPQKGGFLDLNAVLAGDDEEEDDLIARPPGTATLSPAPRASREALREKEREFLLELRDSTQGNVSEMARRIGCERSTVRRRCEKRGVPLRD